MSQPPPGGYPPPGQPQPGQQPQPGAYPPPAAGYPPAPPPYTPPPAAGGYPPPQAPPQYTPPPATGGYQPPPAQGGYPPPAQGYAPPPPGYGGPSGPGTGGPSGGAGSIDLSKVTTGNWIVLGLGVLLFIFSFFGWISSSYDSVGGWHLWWWLIVLIELAILVIYALTTLGVIKPGPIKPVFLAYGAALGFVLYVVALIQIFSSYTYSASSQLDSVCSDLTGAALTECRATYSDIASSYSSGPGFGIWASVVLSAAFVYFIALWAQKTDKLPFKVPGPSF